jgi:hypothetical protein
MALRSQSRTQISVSNLPEIQGRPAGKAVNLTPPISLLSRKYLTRAGPLTMQNGVFWDVTPCGSCKNRRFGGT